jgi:drug/metabolite transporter (DMT)-like permease
VTSRPAVLTGGALAMAIVSASTSGPLIAYAAAPALAIAFWRNSMAVGVIGPAALIRRRPELRALVGPNRRAGLFCVLAGVALAVHFGCWVPSAKLTTVATATALVATQPVWQGLIAVLQGHRLPGASWAGIAVAVLGAIVATGADVRGGGPAVLGDLLALAGAVAAAVYFAFGEQARTTTSTTTYTAVCYLVCGSLLLVVCLVGRQSLGGYPATAWVALAALTVGPQLLGHSMLSFALRRVPATTVSVLILIEVPAAALLGWVWLGQALGPVSMLGMGLLLVGVAVVIVADRAGPKLAEATAGVVDY